MSFDNANLRPLAILCKFFNKKIKFIDSLQRITQIINNFKIKLFPGGVNLEKIQSLRKNCRIYLDWGRLCGGPGSWYPAEL